MFYKFNTVTIEETIAISGNPCLKFTFLGKFTEHASIESAEAWAEIFRKNPEETYELIWDCTHMRGFELGARKQWYRRLSIYKRRIAKVTTISNNIVIRSAAKVMLDFFNIPNTAQKPLRSPADMRRESIFLSVF